jgi:hypothetical protein
MEKMDKFAIEEETLLWAISKILKIPAKQSINKDFSIRVTWEKLIKEGFFLLQVE